MVPCWQRSLFVLGTRRRRDLCLDLTRFLSRMCKNCHDNEVIFTTWYQTGFCGSNLVIQRLTVVWRQTNVSRPDKTEKLLSFVLLSLLSQFHLWKYQLHNLEHFKQHEKPRNYHAVQASILTLRAQCHYSVIQLWACILFVFLNRFQNLFYKMVWLVHDHGLRKCQI
jgi:hypothetical protein